MVGLAAFAALPLLVHAVRIATPAWVDFHVEGDMALVELATRHAAEGRQLLGPYSRFGFHHPGPAMFYLLAPLYAVSGGRFESLLLGALLANAAVLAAVAWTARRAGGRSALVAALLVLPLLALWIRPSYLCSVWNPNLSIVPFLAALVALAAVAAGRVAFLPLAVGAGSFALQCHLGFLLPLAAAFAATAVARLVGPVRDWLALPRQSSVRHRAAVALAAGLAAVIWTPPLVEQLTGSPGNVTRVAEFLRQPSAPHGLVESVWAVAAASGAVVLAPAGARLGGTAEPAQVGLVGFLLGALLPAAIVVAQRERRPFATALAVVGLAVWPASVLVVRAIAGDVHEYLLRWLSALGALELLAVAAALAPAARRALGARRAALVVGKALLLAVGLGLAALSMRLVLEVVPLGRQAEGPVYRRVAAAVAACRQAIAARGVGEVELVVDHPAAWGLAAGLVLHLEKGGTVVSVAPDLAPIYGPRHVPRSPGAVLVIAAPGRVAPGGDVVFADDRVALRLAAPPPHP